MGRSKQNPRGSETIQKYLQIPILFPSVIRIVINNILFVFAQKQKQDTKHLLVPESIYLGLAYES